MEPWAKSFINSYIQKYLIQNPAIMLAKYQTDRENTEKSFISSFVDKLIQTRTSLLQIYQIGTIRCKNLV